MVSRFLSAKDGVARILGGLRAGRVAEEKGDLGGALQESGPVFSLADMVQVEKTRIEPGPCRVEVD
jgi:hypothetical protein